MSFIKTILDTNIPYGAKHTIPKPVLDIFRKLRQQWQEHAQVINGGLEIGNPTSGAVNMRGTWVAVATPVSANTDFTVTHNLGRPAVDFRPTTKDNACDVYLSPTSNPSPNTQIILRATGSSVNLTFFFQ